MGTEGGKDEPRQRQDAKRILKHAVGVFAFSTWFTGMLQALSATRQFGNESQWRTAHVGGTMHACFMFAMAGSLREFSLSDADRSGLAYYTILMGWGNSLGYTVGALIGARGLELTGLDRNIPPLTLFVTAMGALAKVLQLSWKGAQ